VVLLLEKAVPKMAAVLDAMIIESLVEPLEHLASTLATL
jgi:hypothetical protein